jgi:sulfite reductase alpha subunit
MFPGIAAFHTMRVAQPSGKYYSSEFLRSLCDIWDLRGSGLTNMHGSTGDIVLLGTQTPQLEEIYWQLTHDMKNDLGGSGSNLRTPSACLGMSRCEFACYNTQDICYQLTMDYQDELHRPAFPYKFKFKFDGCPNGCVCAMARSDFAVVGTWKDDIKIDNEIVQEYVAGKLKPNAGAHSGRDWGPFDIEKEVVERCPSGCMKWDSVSRKLSIKTRECVRCMHCINTMPKALHIGDERGATILVGAKAPVVDGAQMGSVLVPFVEVQEPYDEIKELIENIWDWWMEEGKNRERVGETMKRLSFQKLLEATNVPAQPCQIKDPRSNPFIFFKESEVPGGWNRSLADYRKRHQR